MYEGENIFPVKRVIYLLLCAVLLLTGPGRAETGADQNPATDRVVILVLDGLPLEFFSPHYLPALEPLLESGAVGLMNNNTGDLRIPASGYLTIGAGSRARARSFSSGGFNTETEIPEQEGRTAGEEFVHRTGLTPRPGNVVQINIAGLHSLNEELPYRVQPGLLGEMLRGSGKKTAVLGNTDFFDEKKRPIVNLLMDEAGIIDRGDVELAAGPNTLAEKAVDLLYEVDVLAVELGAVAQLERQVNLLTEERYRSEMAVALRGADTVIEALLSNIDLGSSLLLLITPTPARKESEEGRILTPVLLSGKEMEGDLLSSPTTRRRGLIANIDLLPTVLSLFDLEIPDQAYGAPVHTQRASEPLTVLHNMQERIARTYLLRRPVIQGYIFLKIALYLFMAAVLILNLRLSEMQQVLAGFLLIFALSFPLALLLLPALNPPNLTAEISLGVLLSLFLAGCSLQISRQRIDPLLILSGLTVTLIAVDLIFGAPLIRKSLLGYDPVGGARFYGLGNEYMGVLLGGIILVSTGLEDRLPKFNLKYPILAVYLATVFLIGFPLLGANFGGTLAAAFGLSLTFIRLYGVETSPRRLSAALLGVLLLLGLSLWGLSLFEGAAGVPTHIGRALGQLLDGEDQEILNTVIRKLDMNLRLIRHTVWSRVFLAALAVFGIMIHRPTSALKRFTVEFPMLATGFQGIIAASFIILLANDSGIVGAATCILYATTGLLFILLCQAQPE